MEHKKNNPFAFATSFIAGLTCGGLGYHSSQVLSDEVRTLAAGNRFDNRWRFLPRMYGTGAYFIALQVGLNRTHNVPGFDAGLIAAVVLPDTLLMAGEALAGAAYRDKVNWSELFKAARHRLVCQCALMGPIMLYNHRQVNS